MILEFFQILLCFLKVVHAAFCESCSAHSLSFALSENRELALIPLLIQEQPYTPNYSLIHPLHTVFLQFSFIAQVARNAGRPSSFLQRNQFGNTSSNTSLEAAFLGEIQSTLECPDEGNTKAELCD